VSPKPGYAEGYETFAPLLVAAILLFALLGQGRRAGNIAEAST